MFQKLLSMDNTIYYRCFLVFEEIINLFIIFLTYYCNLLKFIVKKVEVFMSFFDLNLSATEEMTRGIQSCDLKRVEMAISTGADVNHNNVFSLNQAIQSKCDITFKQKCIDYLLKHNATPNKINTLLAMSILHGDHELISFSFNKISDFNNEDVSFLYALQKGNCEIALKLLHAGVKISDEVIEIAEDINIKNACTEIYKLQDFNTTLSIHSDQVYSDLFSLEKSILLGHNLCSNLAS